MAAPHTDTQAHILATGRRLTARRGYTGVGLNDLLKAAGVPKGSFYHYFSSKEGYGCALLEAYVEDYMRRLDQTLGHPAQDARTRLLAFFARWREKQAGSDPEGRCLVVKLSAEVADLSPDMSRIIRDGISTILARLADTLRRGMADGSIGAVDDPQALAETLYHLWLGASLVASLGDDAPLQSALRATEAVIPTP